MAKKKRSVALARRRRFFTRSKKVSRHTKFTLPIAVIAGLAPGVANVFGHFQSDGIGGAAAEASRIYTGYSPTNKYGYNDTIGWHPYLMRYGLLPLAAGFLVHKFVGGTLGVNRAIAKAGIPIIRL